MRFAWGTETMVLPDHKVATLIAKQSKHCYRISSIKRPRRLFKTWPQGPGVYLKPAFNRGPEFINEVKFSSFLG